LRENKLAGRIVADAQVRFHFRTGSVFVSFGIKAKREDFPLQPLALTIGKQVRALEDYLRQGASHIIHKSFLFL